MVGVDDEVGDRGSIEVRVLADGKDLYNSGLMRGDGMAPTPPMGWNSWGSAADDRKIREGAAAVVKTDLVDHGWQQ